jgi:hypothetical protein
VDASTSNPETAAAATTTRVRGLLEARGVFAGPLYGPLHVAAGMVRMLVGDGFDTGGRRALGLLSNGDPGPIRTADFLVTGLPVIAGAADMRRVLRRSRGGTWGPLLIGVYEVGLIGAGFFRADQALGFPPGLP